MRKAILLGIILLGLISCGKIAWLIENYPSDNPIEEGIEEIIENEIGQDIDLSPFSEEEKDCDCVICEEKRKKEK